MLVLEIEFLTGRYRATNYRTRDTGEWPPHPSRIFSALVAAFYGSDLGDTARDALLWLEQQPAPEIAAGPVIERDTLVHFVPVNDEPLPAEHRNRQPRSFPTVHPEKPTVHFIWPHATPSREIRSALESVARGITYVGHSSSLVRAAFLEAVDVKPTHKPSEMGKIPLRVPAPGRLQSLIDDFNRNRPPSVGAFSHYRMDGSHEPDDTVESTFGEMIVFRYVEGPAIPITASINLTSILRDAVLAHAGADAPPVFHGHGDEPHLAYVPIPFVGHRYADGHLMGCAVVLPRGISRLERRRILAVLARVETLKLGSLGQWDLEQVIDPGRAMTLDPSTWTRQSTTWASVTPVVFDRFPRNRVGREAADIIATSCTRIGLPVPQRIEVVGASRFPGVPPAAQFRARRKDEERPRLFSHIVLHFGRSVGGPVIIGASRFFGLGLCRPWKEQRQ